MQPIRIAIIIAFSMMLSSCFSMRMAYRADLIDKKTNKEGQVEYRTSVDVGVHGVACLLTGWYYGGWCWIYAFMPFDGQEEAVKREARRRIHQDYPRKRYRLTWENTNHLGWYDATPSFQRWGGMQPVEEEDEDLDADLDRDPVARDLNDENVEIKSTVKLVKPKPLPDGFTFAADFGTSFSPHGFGASVGYRFTPVAVHLGYGLMSKRFVMGNPVSLGLEVIFGDDLFIRSSLTRYEGTGDRVVKTKTTNERYGSTKFLEVKDLYWNVVYTHLQFGQYFQLAGLDRWRGYAAAGISWVSYRQFAIPNEEYTNIAEPEGIVVDEGWQQSIAGAETDRGVGFMVGVSYAL